MSLRKRNDDRSMLLMVTLNSHSGSRKRQMLMPSLSFYVCSFWVSIPWGDITHTQNDSSFLRKSFLKHIHGYTLECVSTMILNTVGLTMMISSHSLFALLSGEHTLILCPSPSKTKLICSCFPFCVYDISSRSRGYHLGLSSCFIHIFYDVTNHFGY